MGNPENAVAAGQRMTRRLIAARVFMERILPASTSRLARVKAGAESTMALPMEAF
jgi:hypothetical protein